MKSFKADNLAKKGRKDKEEKERELNSGFNSSRNAKYTFGYNSSHQSDTYVQSRVNLSCSFFTNNDITVSSLCNISHVCVD